ncbi:MAG: hypothetical protein JWO80_1012 [Bryobacterales bacterium]|nr:hypothetical protein [Bryobacterales bacterium]
MELAAGAIAGALTSDEIADLSGHLRECGECREVWLEYQILAREGFPFLSADYEHREAMTSWNDTASRRRLFARIAEPDEALAVAADFESSLPKQPRRKAPRINLWALVAACLLIAVGVAAGRLGSRRSAEVATVPARAAGNPVSVTAATGAALAAQTQRLASLEAESSAKGLEVAKLRSELQALQARWSEERVATRAAGDELEAARTDYEQRLHEASLQRDHLSEQLHETSQEWQKLQTELASLRAERDPAMLRLRTLEARVGELIALNHEQERLLGKSERYLSADGDIRELMGARNLYIADVFDVDNNSRTRKPFGRVFYTRGKSLIFYAFDLDQQSDVRNASAFQVWGKKETVQGERANSLNLGILYLDSESSRRWSLRFDNPRTLSRIDAVFVTVEPNGGSAKPTGKPFLYAVLRKEANHP